MSRTANNKSETPLAHRKDGEHLEVGLRPLLQAFGRAVGGIFSGLRARRITRLVGDRYTIRVDDTGVQTRGLIRTHRADWADAESVVLEPVAAMATRRIVGRATSQMIGRIVPIPGLRWLADKVVGAITDPVADLAADITPALPDVFVAVRTRKGKGIELDGPLALTSLLSRNLTHTVVKHAESRRMPVVRDAG